MSNEHIILIDMLYRMYNDNIHQITDMTNSINNLRNTNNQIRNILIQALLYPSTSNNLNRNNNRNNDRNNNRNNDRNNDRNNNRNNEINNNRNNEINNNRNNNRNQRQTNEIDNLGRVIFDNVPYVIDSIQQYTIPFTNSVSNNTNTYEERNTNFSSLMQNFLQPVEVYPTQSQIETATRNVRYCDIVNPINRSCPISLDTFTDSDMVSVIRFCGHIFRRDQLNIWFRSNCKCPICRYDIRNYNSNPTSSIFESSISVDSSNNLVGENLSDERIIPQQTHASRPNTMPSFLDNVLNEFSNLSNVTDPTALLTLLRALQNQRL